MGPIIFNERFNTHNLLVYTKFPVKPCIDPTKKKYKRKKGKVVQCPCSKPSHHTKLPQNKLTTSSTLTASNPPST